MELGQRLSRRKLIGLGLDSNINGSYIYIHIYVGPDDNSRKEELALIATPSESERNRAGHWRIAD